MSARTDAIIRALTRRGYSECTRDPTLGYRRFRISPTHARRVEHHCARLRRAIFGDIFVCENGLIMIGATRRLSVALAQPTVANLLRDGQPPPAKRRPTTGPPMTLEELLAP